MTVQISTADRDALAKVCKLTNYKVFFHDEYKQGLIQATIVVDSLEQSFYLARMFDTEIEIQQSIKK